MGPCRSLAESADEAYPEIANAACQRLVDPLGDPVDHSVVGPVGAA